MRAELEKTRETLRGAQSTFSAFRLDEHAALSRKVDELAAELAEQKEVMQHYQKGAAERHAVVDELGSLRRWRAEVVAPFVESSEGTLAQLERAIPPLQRGLEEVDTRVSKHLPELLGAADAAAMRHQGLEEEASRVASVVERLGEAHSMVRRSAVPSPPLLRSCS